MDRSGLEPAPQASCRRVTARIHIRPAAQHDLDSLTDYFLAEVDADMAGHFVENASKSFNALLQTPGLGPPVPHACRSSHRHAQMAC
jgi:plasmid stabilization system protein ParE